VPLFAEPTGLFDAGDPTLARPLAALVLRPLLCDVLDIGGFCEFYIPGDKLQRLAHLHSPSLIVTNDQVQFWIVGRQESCCSGSQHVAEVSCYGQIPHGIGVSMGG
jgi:hypothetical protein